jgi:hypothetical protein
MTNTALSNGVAGPLSVPAELTDAELALARGTAANPASPADPVPSPVIVEAVAGPALDPPGTPGAASTLPVGFASVKVLALFSSDQPNTGQANLDGVGWRRLATTNDSAHANLGLLASAARIQGTAAPVRHEADNQIHEIYVW